MTKSSSIHRVPSTGAVEHGYPQGHLGHLTASEEQALVEFKAFLQEKDLWTPGPPASHNDQTLLRFLRARKWAIQDAYEQFSETERFRKANDINVLYDTMDIDAYEEAKRLYPRFLGRRDRRGIPIYLFEIKHLDSSTVAKYEKAGDTTYSSAKTDGKTPGKLLRLFALYENLTRFVQPLCTECTDRPHSDTPITLSTNIVDVSQVGLRQFWNLKGHMQAASQLATAHYPETLDRIFIIGAPYFFSTVWGWIKRWFDPVTVSKIFILSHAEVLPVLSSFIDPKNIPKQYGGELDFNFFDEPRWDDPEIERIITWKNGHTKVPPGPMYLRPCEDGTTIELLAVGSKDKKHRMEVFATIPKAHPHATEAAAPAESLVTNPVPLTDGPVEDLNKLTIADETKKEEASEVSEKVASEPAAPEEAAVIS
ncbi:CRAL-TRIO domain-containing protein [Xylariales sp. PMI_506]|nr:CRAL-TRIO domain-containing protein [Xylariales sp. PMI_506]